MATEVDTVDGILARRGGWEWPNWALGSPRPGRRERVGANVWAAFFLLFLIQPIDAAFGGAHGWGFRLAVAAIVAAIGVSYVIAIAKGPEMAHRDRLIVIAVLTAMPVSLAVLLGPNSLLFLTYAVSPALLILPRYVGLIHGVLSAAALLIATRVVAGVAYWNGAMVLVTLTGGMFAFGALIRTVRELRFTQDKMARLAVAEERSRLARDLHDVLGHSLTTITVKAGLARRILETSPDRERAISEVRDVEELARRAMTDVRATVSGYRTASLPAELVGARAALSAAGIDADLPHAVDGVTPGLQETFAYVLREGVTNVIRHSGAARCDVRFGDTWLEVRDDGRSAAEAVRSSRARGGGHGLSGLAERLGAVGGELSAGPLPTGGFLLRADVTGPGPAAQPAPAKVLLGQPTVGLA